MCNSVFMNNIYYFYNDNRSYSEVQSFNIIGNYKINTKYGVDKINDVSKKC